MTADLSCPKCGHTALSIATRCPQCGHPFESRLWQSPVSAGGRRRIPTGLVITGVVAVLVVVGVAQRESRDPVSYAPVRSPARSAVSAAPRPQPAVVQPAESIPTADSAAQTDTTPAVAQAAAEAEIETPPPPPPPVESTSPADEPAERRYASTWVNVRAGRSGSAEVVQILKPGEAVRVDSLRLGWYRVLSGGQPLGYVDRSLVGTDPEPASP